MAAIHVTIEIRLRCWVVPYMAVLCFVAWVCRTEPDVEKLSALIARRGWRIKTRRA